MKTTGSRGLHIYVPIVRGPTQKEIWAFSKTFAHSLAARYPRLITVEYRVEKRPAGHVLVDYNQNEVELQSKSGQPLTRYFPDIVASLQALRPRSFLLDGEIVIPVNGELSFDELLLRIHPAASRVDKLAREHPGVFVAFDLLVAGALRCRFGKSHTISPPSKAPRTREVLSCF